MKPPTRLKAEFLETARTIVSADRAAKRAGRTQNTIGAIRRAMERAFVAGSTFTSRDDDESVNWLTLAPKARAALDRVAFSGFLDGASDPVILTPVASQTGSLRWSLRGASDNLNSTLADSGVSPLLRAGALQELPDGRLELSPLGREIYADYRLRRDVGEPLPLEGFR